MNRRTLGSIGLFLAGAGLYALVDVLRTRASDPAPGAPSATSADVAAPDATRAAGAPLATPTGPAASDTPTPSPSISPPSPPPPPLPAHPAAPSGPVGGTRPPEGPQPPTAPTIAPPPIAPPVAPPVVGPPPSAPPRGESPPAGPSPATRRLLELTLEMRSETLRILQALSEVGRVNELQVVDAELAVLDARHDLADLSDRDWHRARVEILARRAEAAATEVTVGHVSQDVGDLAKLDLARERALAGEPSDYATTRDAVLARSAARRRTLVDAGRLSAREALAADLANERRFPRLPTDPPPPR